MSSQYSGDDYSENYMESHAEERDKNSSESSDSEEEQSSITTENSSEEEIDPWTTLINHAACTMTSCKHFSWRVTTN